MVFAIHQHELATGIHVSPPSGLPLPPTLSLWVFPEHWLKQLVLRATDPLLSRNYLSKILKFEQP